MTGVRAATNAEVGDLPLESGVGAAAIATGDPRSILVHWLSGVCGIRGVVRVAVDGSHVGIHLTSEPCDDVGLVRAIVLTFAEPMDAGTLSIVLEEITIAVTDLHPGTLAILGKGNAWVGGTVSSGDATVWRLKGHTPWWVHAFGIGSTRDLAVTDRGHVYATVGCSGHDRCRSGLYRGNSSGRFELLRAGRYGHISFLGPDGVVIVPSTNTNPTGVSLIATADSGATWSPVPTSCPSGTFLQDAVSLGSNATAVICVGGAGGGSQAKALLTTDDAGRHWTVRSTTERKGGLPFSGTVFGFDLRPDGTGWLWGPRAPLSQSVDGGRTWRSLPVADGDLRIVAGASLYGAENGGVLVWDPDRQATLLLETIDGGSTWDEVYAFPQGFTRVEKHRPGVAHGIWRGAAVETPGYAAISLPSDSMGHARSKRLATPVVAIPSGVSSGCTGIRCSAGG